MGQCYSWKSIKKNTVPDFSYQGKKLYAKVVDLYDGDTGRIVFRDNLRLVQYKFRLYGVDTPELKPSLKLKDRTLEINKAKKARDFLGGLILNKVVFIEFLNFDKYGRLLVKIYKNRWSRTSYNQILLEKGFGKSYFGGTK